MSRLRWPRLSAPALFNTVAIIFIVATQLHIVISAPASTAGPPPDDVSAHVIDDVTAARRPAGVPSDGGSVRSNEAGTATRDIIRLRRHLLAAQGCGPVCNRCRQVRSLCSARRLVRPVAVSNKCIDSSWQGCHTATGTHMPHGITQCYLPSGRADIPALTPAEAGTRLSDPGGMQG